MGSGALSAGPPAPPTPHKKMKKRKELNALIGLAADGVRKKAKKGSGHRLLRTEPPASDSETDTEEEDEFGSLGDTNGRFGRGSLLQCCKMCYPLCGFVVLAACVVTCIGLVWMQVVLKENMDVLKEKFRAMESNQKNSLEELPKINEDLISKQKYLDDIMTGEKGLNKLWSNITEMNKQIALLTSAVSHLKETIKSASELINLPNTMAELQKSVATLGSTLTSVHNDVGTMQAATEEQKKKVDILQKDMQDVLFLQNAFDDMNTTLQQYQRQNDYKLYSVDTIISNLTQRIALFEHELHLASKRENMSQSSVDSTASPSNIADPGNKATPTESSQGPSSGQPSTLRQKLQFIHALTNQPESGKQALKDLSGGEAVPSQTTLTRVAPRSVHSSGQELPGISTEKDLEDLFSRSLRDAKGKLSYQELQNLLGPALPALGYLKQFDTDGDDRYSVTELKALLRAQQ